MNFSVSVKLDLPIVNLIQIIIYKSAKKEKCSCSTLKVQKRDYDVGTQIRVEIQSTTLSMSSLRLSFVLVSM
jgi:ABC-type transport system involved in Fe-S cluster assembly fused permease/ATPase subunit